MKVFKFCSVFSSAYSQPFEGSNQNFPVISPPCGQSNHNESGGGGGLSPLVTYKYC